MYYIRDKNEKDKVNLDDFSTIFNYKELMYKDHKESFENAINGTPKEQNFICDLSAALLANIYKTSYAHKDIIEKSLQSCEKIIQNIGYQSFHQSTFISEARKRGDDENTLLVVGCQNQQMLQNRVEKAAQFTIDSGAKFKVIFSGNSPKGNRSRITNEYMEMEKCFLTYLENRDIPFERHEIVVESDSSTTKENIMQVFDKHLNDSRGKTHLYIASSSFHLIRLSEEIETILNNENIKNKIKSVNLIGAEAINKEFYNADSFSSLYLRTMLFDVFRHILIVYPKKKEEEKKKQDAIDTENRRLEKIESDKREKELMDKSAEI